MNKINALPLKKKQFSWPLPDIQFTVGAQRVRRGARKIKKKARWEGAKVRQPEIVSFAKP